MFSRRPNPVFSAEYAVIRQAVIQARHNAKLSQAKLAALLGKATSHITMIERGQRRIDTLELYAMALAFGVQPTTFFADIAARLDSFDDPAPDCLVAKPREDRTLGGTGAVQN